MRSLYLLPTKQWGQFWRLVDEDFNELKNYFLNTDNTQFLDLPWRPAMDKFISNHMKVSGKMLQNTDSPFHAQSLNSSTKVLKIA